MDFLYTRITHPGTHVHMSMDLMPLCGRIGFLSETRNKAINCNCSKGEQAMRRWGVPRRTKSSKEQSRWRGSGRNIEFSLEHIMSEMEEVAVNYQ